MNGLHELTLADALARIAAGELEPSDVVEACQARIARREPGLRAWAHLEDPDAAGARSAVARTRPLAGLPVAIKDVIDVEGMPTRHGSPLRSGRPPASQDAASVALLRAAGLVPAGKAQTSEFAYFEPAPTLNPRDPERTPGGSSSGPAAAVADCMVPVALGTQTAGSVIRPASYCGVVGYVATQGELPLRGIQPLAPSFDALGIFARSVEDVRIVRHALTDAASVAAADHPRLLLFESGAIVDVDDAMRRALTDVVTALTAAGASVHRFEGSELLAEAGRLHHDVMAYEARRALAAEWQAVDRLSRPLKELLHRGAEIPHSEYRSARMRLRQIGEHIAESFDRIDAVLAPAAPGEAPPRAQGTGSPELSRPWQALGLPALGLPAPRPPDALPVGVQLVGPAFGDDALLALGAWAESALHVEAGVTIAP
jgi:Asp-tRNA(Asn)/Glu-tRNA(Gln) amidotransferase A subunit family amidase